MERMAYVEPSCDTRARTSILVRDHYLGTGIKSSGWNDCCVWRLAEIWLQLLPAKPQNPVRKNPHDAQKFLSPFRQNATAPHFRHRAGRARVSCSTSRAALR